MAKLGDPIDKSKMTKGNPPLLFQLQPEGFIAVESASDVKDFEERLKKFYGIDRGVLGGITLLDTCSGGCADDCGCGGPS